MGMIRFLRRRVDVQCINPHNTHTGINQELRCFAREIWMAQVTISFPIVVPTGTDQQRTLCGKGCEIGIQSVYADGLVIASLKHRHNNPWQEEALQRVLGDRFAMRDEMRCSINMCASVRANMYLGDAPRRGCLCRRNMRFGVAWKVCHTVFNLMG